MKLTKHQTEQYTAKLLANGYAIEKDFRGDHLYDGTVPQMLVLSGPQENLVLLITSKINPYSIAEICNINLGTLLNKYSDCYVGIVIENSVKINELLNEIGKNVADSNVGVEYIHALQYIFEREFVKLDN